MKKEDKRRKKKIEQKYEDIRKNITLTSEDVILAINKDDKINEKNKKILIRYVLNPITLNEIQKNNLKDIINNSDLTNNIKKIYFNIIKKPFNQYLINTNFNKLWNIRYKFINSLVNWIIEDKKFNIINKKGTKKDKSVIYENIVKHIMIGRMYYPNYKRDKLFVFNNYYNSSLLRLFNNKERVYLNFLERQKLLLNEMRVNIDELPVISWNYVSRKLNKKTLDYLQLLQDELCNNYNIIKGKLGYHPNVFITQHMISLILRYKCIYAFDTNLQASISKSLSNKLSDFTECFASPFNHKFKNYFSIFDEDIIFGSKGNFFNFIDNNNNKFPSGSYEINPPFINEVFEEIAFFINNSDMKDTKILIVAPNWNDSKYYIEYNKILKKENLKKYSVFKEKTEVYNTVGNLNEIKLPTYYWFFSDHLFNYNSLFI